MSSVKHTHTHTDVQEFGKGYTDQYWFNELVVDHHKLNCSLLPPLPAVNQPSPHRCLRIQTYLCVIAPECHSEKHMGTHTFRRSAPNFRVQACSSQTLTWLWLCCRWGFCGRLWDLSVGLWRLVGSGDTDTSPGQTCRPTAWLQTGSSRITVRLRQLSERTKISWVWMFTCSNNVSKQTQNILTYFFIFYSTSRLKMCAGYVLTCD